MVTSTLDSSQSTPAAGRLQWIDAAKGTAILLVVIGHAWRGLQGSGLIPDGLFEAVDSRIYAFHMPAFFAMVGLFFVRTLERLSPADFVRIRLFRLFWAMVLWTYLFLGAKVLAGQLANTPASLEDMLILPVPGVLHLWFLWALLLLSITFSLMRPFLRDGRVPGVVLWICIGGVAALQFLPLPPELARWIGPAVRNAPYFLLGIVLSQTGWLSNVSPRLRIASFLVFCVLIFFWPYAERQGLSTLGGLILTWCFLNVFTGLGSMAGSLPVRGLILMGGASMAIYQIHTIFSAGLREVLLVLGVQDVALHMALGTLIGVIMPLVILELARRTGTTRLLGL